MKIKNIKYEILLILTMIALLSSAILSFVPAQEVCNIDDEGCSVVYNSSYNNLLGIKNSYYGVCIFLLLFLLIYYQIKKPTDVKRNIIHATIILGSVLALSFLYIQEFILHAYCKYCVMVDISMLIALGITLYSWKK